MVVFVLLRLGLRVELGLVDVDAAAVLVDGQLLLLVAHQLTLQHLRLQPQVLDVLSGISTKYNELGNFLSAEILQ